VTALHRHDLAWLRPRWRDSLLTPLEAVDEAAIADWADRGRPAVVCRSLAGAPAGAVTLGVALPGPGRRLGLLVRAEAVARRGAPLRLRDAAASAPQAWRGPLAALDHALRSVGVTAGVFGSLAWQHLVGEPYLRPTSDVDLLLELPGPASPWPVVDLLLAHDRGAPRLDGELLLPGGRAVAWRELATRPARVLVKSIDGVALLPLDQALGWQAQAQAQARRAAP
jgi:phosphoribosyl-dephospho-CoA transferase